MFWALKGVAILIGVLFRDILGLGGETLVSIGVFERCMHETYLSDNKSIESRNILRRYINDTWKQQ